MVKYSGLTIFILFFGLSLVEAIVNKNWLEAVIFILLGIMFIIHDKKRK